jgi:MFS family permease
MDSLGRIAGPLFAMLLYGWQIELPFIVGGVLCIAAIVLVQRFRALEPKGAASKNEAAIQ